MVYQKACEIDNTEKRKKPVIVTEVYDPPLPAETDRGRSGEYIDLLRPLLLSQGSFEGKLCALCNQIGLFTAYTEKLKDNPVVQRKIAAIKHENDLDIWQPEFYPKIGERYYASILKGNLRRRIKYALDSLQRQTIVRWKDITRIVPDISTETDEGWEIDRKRNRRQTSVSQNVSSKSENRQLQKIRVWTQIWLFPCCYRSTQRKNAGITDTSKSDMGAYSHLQRMRDRSRR